MPTENQDWGPHTQSELEKRFVARSVIASIKHEDRSNEIYEAFFKPVPRAFYNPVDGEDFNKLIGFFDPIEDSKDGVFRIKGVHIWSYYFTPTFKWVRIFKWGLKWKHWSEGLTFSEREGHTKVWAAPGGWNVSFLPKIISIKKSK